MPSMPDFEKSPDGQYVTDGLAPKQFNRLFDLIHQDRQARRRKSRRQLTPALLKNRNLEDILTLGKKRDGTFFTKDDLKEFEKSRKQTRAKYSNSKPGITYAQLVASARDIDVKRANNSVTDGSGIKSASFIGIKHNVAIISVTASDRSEDSHHQVELRFEEWDEAMDEATDDIAQLQRVTRNLAKGRVSINCDCRRYMYWYRYIATAGNFTIAPPKEYIYPKIRNPRLQGVACKHIIHAFTRMQAAGWQSRLVQSLRKNAAGEHYGDDPKRTHEFFSDSEVKQLNRNRKSQTNRDAAKAEWNRYQARLDALAGKLTAANKQKLKTARSKLQRARTITEKERQRRAELKTKLTQATAERDAFKQQLADALKLQKQIFIDAQVMAGKTPEEARKAFEQHLNNKMGR